MCEYKEDMNTALSLIKKVLYELFSGLQKVIRLLLYFGLFILLVWGHLSEEWLSLFFMGSDQGTTPMTAYVSLPTPSPLPFITKDVLTTFYVGKKCYILKCIPIVLQVELRSSPLWDFHDW